MNKMPSSALLEQLKKKQKKAKSKNQTKTYASMELRQGRDDTQMLIEKENDNH